MIGSVEPDGDGPGPWEPQYPIAAGSAAGALPIAMLLLQRKSFDRILSLR
jgi:hypothetical protein